MSDGAQQADIYRGPRIDDYETPDWIWKPLNDQYHFTVDLAASVTNRKCSVFYSSGWLEDPGSLLPWVGKDGVAWLNPPFSRAAEFFEVADGFRIVAIYKLSNMETRAWRHIFSSCSWIAIPEKRVQYLLDGKPVRATSGKRAGKISSCQFASAVIGFNVPKPKKVEGMWPHTVLEVSR